MEDGSGTAFVVLVRREKIRKKILVIIMIISMDIGCRLLEKFMEFSEASSW